VSFRVLLLADQPGWIVERVCRRMQEGIPEVERVDYYTRIDAADLVRLGSEFDLIHYGNWDCEHVLAAFPEVRCPLVLSIRSHRSPPYVREAARLATVVHTITPDLQAQFPGSIYIPNGTFDLEEEPREFVVGFAGRPDEYKGFPLIAEACARAGAVFKPATGDVPPGAMGAYYRSIDVYVCASRAEGHSTPVMECLALNKPVISTRVGLPTTLAPTPLLTFVERDVESIAAAIRARMTRAQVLPKYSWELVCAELRRLYAVLAGSAGRVPPDYVGRYDADLVSWARRSSEADGAGDAAALRMALEEERKRNHAIVSLTQDLVRAERAADAATRRALAAEAAVQAQRLEIAALRAELSSRTVQALRQLRRWVRGENEREH
jgi:hypothetical protein